MCRKNEPRYSYSNLGEWLPRCRRIILLPILDALLFQSDAEFASRSSGNESILYSPFSKSFIVGAPRTRISFTSKRKYVETFTKTLYGLTTVGPRIRYYIYSYLLKAYLAVSRLLDRSYNVIVSFCSCQPLLVAERTNDRVDLRMPARISINTRVNSVARFVFRLGILFVHVSRPHRRRRRMRQKKRRGRTTRL